MKIVNSIAKALLKNADLTSLPDKNAAQVREHFDGIGEGGVDVELTVSASGVTARVQDTYFLATNSMSQGQLERPGEKTQPLAEAVLTNTKRGIDIPLAADSKGNLSGTVRAWGAFGASMLVNVTVSAEGGTGKIAVNYVCKDGHKVVDRAVSTRSIDWEAYYTTG